MNRILIPNVYFQMGKEHLFKGFGEHFLFFLCNINMTDSGVDFLVEDIELIREQDTKVIGHFSVEITLTRLIEVMNKANLSGLALIEAHNHPRKFGNKFSHTDEVGFSEFVPYILEVLQRPYGATVWESDEVIHAKYWDCAMSKHFPIHSIEVTGTQGQTLSNIISGKVLFFET